MRRHGRRDQLDDDAAAYEFPLLRLPHGVLHPLRHAHQLRLRRRAQGLQVGNLVFCVEAVTSVSFDRIASMTDIAVLCLTSDPNDEAAPLARHRRE